MAQIDVSLIVCTRNRLESLKTTIASFDNLVIPPDWTTELVVVDNGSTDGTLDFLQAARCRIPLRVVNALQPGLSRARRLGERWCGQTTM
jgi:glycosyltransferase involved in cell wall biosynthesis